MGTGGRTASIVARLTRRRAHIWLAIALVVGGAAVGLVANTLPWTDSGSYECAGVLALPPSLPSGYDVIPVLTYLCLIMLSLLVAFGRLALLGWVTRWAAAAAGVGISVVYTVLATRAVATLDVRIAEITKACEGFVGDPGVASIQIVAGVSMLVGAVIVVVALCIAEPAFRSGAMAQRAR